MPPNVTDKTRTSKSKLTALFSVRRWLREIPCSAAQAQVLFALASFARPDGTGVHPGQNGLEAVTKLDRRTIGRALKDWRTVGAITRTHGGNRRLKRADEYEINLDWQPSNATVGHFCKSGPESHLKNSFGTSESSFGTLSSSNGTPDHPIEESSSSKRHFIENARAPSSARKTAAPQSGLAAQPNFGLRVSSENNFSARELETIQDAQQYIESQIKHSRRKIPKVSVVQFIKQQDGAFSHERSIVMALAAIRKFPDGAFA